MPDFILGCTHLQTPSGLGSLGSLWVTNKDLTFQGIRQEHNFNVKPKHKILFFAGWAKVMGLLN
jgi:hypothetical protein